MSVKVEVAVLGFTFLISLVVSQCGHTIITTLNRAQGLCECESRGGRPGLPVPNKPCQFL